MTAYTKQQKTTVELSWGLCLFIVDISWGDLAMKKLNSISLNFLSYVVTKITITDDHLFLDSVRIYTPVTYHKPFINVKRKSCKIHAQKGTSI
jgi:hypothetical protein